MRLRRQIAARTRFFDEQILDAIAAGIKQVVICGAGYDDRALRFRHQGVAFFELDHPVTQADKARRLQAMGTDMARYTLADADFRSDDVDVVLDRCGHRADRPSLFVCEGLLVYLDRRSCVRLLADLCSRAASGSWLAVSLATHPAGLDSKRVVSAANAARRAGRAEPWRTILPNKAHLALLEETGWHVARIIDATALDSRIDPDRTQLVVATPKLTASQDGQQAAGDEPQPLITQGHRLSRGPRRLQRWPGAEKSQIRFVEFSTWFLGLTQYEPRADDCRAGHGTRLAADGV